MEARSDWAGTLTGSSSILSELAAHGVELVLREFGMGMGAFDLMSAVRAAGGRETLGEIADRMGIVPSSLTEAIAAAERKGLVERLTVDTNRRAKRVILTAKGEALLERCLRVLERQEKLLRESLSPAEIGQAVATLQRASEILALAGHEQDS